MSTPFTEAELAALYDRYAGVLHHRCQRILRDPDLARDAVHDTFAKVIVHADDFRAQASPLTWMYRIATNHCLNQLRNRKGRAAKLEQHHDTFVLDRIAMPDVERIDHQRLHELLDGVDDEMRRIVLHTWFDECSKAQTAKLVGLSVPTVRKRIQQFLDLARQALAVGAILFQLGSPS